MNRTTTLYSPVRFQNGVSWVPVSECLSTDSSDMQELISSRPEYTLTMDFQSLYGQAVCRELDKILGGYQICLKLQQTNSNGGGDVRSQSTTPSLQRKACLVV